MIDKLDFCLGEQVLPCQFPDELTPMEVCAKLNDNITHLNKEKLNKIDPTITPNGDPENPESDYDVGRQAGVYVEWYSSTGWRPRLLRANNGEGDLLNQSRIPIARSNGTILGRTVGSDNRELANVGYVQNAVEGVEVDLNTAVAELEAYTDEKSGEAIQVSKVYGHFLEIKLIADYTRDDYTISGLSLRATVFNQTNTPYTFDEVFLNTGNKFAGSIFNTQACFGEVNVSVDGGSKALYMVLTHRRGASPNYYLTLWCLNNTNGSIKKIVVPKSSLKLVDTVKSV